MPRKLITTGSPFETAGGYSRAVVDGEWCFVAGTTGYDYATMRIPEIGRRTDPQLLPHHRRRACAKPASRSPTWCARVTTFSTAATRIRFSPSAANISATSGRPPPFSSSRACWYPEMKVEIEVTAKRRTG